MTDANPRALLALVRRERLHPVFRDRGYSAQGRRTWWLGGPDAGWVVAELVGDRHNRADVGSWHVQIAVWPPGTWEFFSRDWTDDPPTVPLSGGPPPVTAGSLQPGTPGPGPDLALHTGMDPAEVHRAADALVSYLATALPWAETMRRADSSAHLIHQPLRTVALRAARSPLLLESLEELTAGFQRDPRPVTLGPTLATWRAEAGLPAVPLPQWWQVHMLPATAQRDQSPLDLFAQGIGTTPRMLADGTQEPMRADLLPGSRQLEVWRGEARRRPVGDGVLLDPPPWLVWQGYL